VLNVIEVSFFIANMLLMTWLKVTNSGDQYTIALENAGAGRSYGVEEDVEKKKVFAENLKKIEIHNYLHSKGLKSFTMGINQFADMVSQISIYYILEVMAFSALSGLFYF
jgi:hypothetical protein